MAASDRFSSVVLVGAFVRSAASQLLPQSLQRRRQRSDAATRGDTWRITIQQTAIWSKIHYSFSSVDVCRSVGHSQFPGFSMLTVNEVRVRVRVRVGIRFNPSPNHNTIPSGETGHSEPASSVCECPVLEKIVQEALN